MSFDTAVPPYNSSDPQAMFLSSSCLDFLLIELVPMASRLVREVSMGDVSSMAPPVSPLPSSPATRGGGGGAAAAAAAAAAAVATIGAGGEVDDASHASSSGNPSSKRASSSLRESHAAMMQSELGGGGGSGSSAAAAAAAAAETGRRRNGGAKGTASDELGVYANADIDEEEEREAVFYRLESLGYRVGQGLVERFSKDKPRFIEPLDVIKFLCKDLWTLIFRKQIDNLKTNHRGVYVLTDNTFRPFQRMSVEAGENATIRALPFLWFPCGVIRGALASMGIEAVVHGDTSDLPAAAFQIKTTAAATTTTGMTTTAPTTTAAAGMSSAPVGNLQ